MAQSLGIVVEAETIAETSEGTTRTEVVESVAPTVVPPEPPAVVMEPSESDVDVVDVFSEGGEQIAEQLVEQVNTDEFDVSGERGPKRGRRRRRRRRRPDDARPAAEAVEIEAEREVEAEREIEAQREVEIERDVEEEDEDEPVSNNESLIVSPMTPVLTEVPSRGKRRRRRRRSDRKRPEGQVREVSEAITTDDSLESKPTEDIPSLDEPAYQASTEDEDHDDDLTDEESGERLIHRGIPTWTEAVGYVVTRNLEARAKNPGGGQRPRGNRHRG